MRETLHQWISKLCYHIALKSEGPEDSSLSFLSLVLTSSPSDHSEYTSRYVLSGAIATDDAESNLREEGTNDEIKDIMLMRKPEPTIISANLDEKLEHSGEAEAKRINAKYGVLPNDQRLTVLEMD